MFGLNVTLGLPGTAASAVITVYTEALVVEPSRLSRRPGYASTELCRLRGCGPDRRYYPVLNEPDESV